MIRAPLERQAPTNDDQQFDDLPLRSHGDPPASHDEPPMTSYAKPPVEQQQRGLGPDWEHPEGVDFTQIEYDYAPKMGSALLIASVCGIAAMAAASLWLVTHATERSPIKTWTWSAPDLSGISAPKVPEELKRLPGDLAAR